MISAVSLLILTIRVYDCSLGDPQKPSRSEAILFKDTILEQQLCRPAAWVLPPLNKIH